jgi:superfamily I DNA/RNA helicase
MSRLVGRIRELIPLAVPQRIADHDREVVLYGPPGTGKTTAMLRLVEAYLGSGATPDRILLVTFTRNARAEALDRLVQASGADPDSFPWIRTIHSVCYHLLGLRPEQVMQPEDYRRFGESYGWRFSLGKVDLDDPYGGASLRSWEDWALFAEQLRRAKLLGHAEAVATFPVPPIGAGWDEDQARRFTERLEDYKRQCGLVDFADMLTMVVEQGLDTGCTHLFVDEAQDLSPAQWAVITAWARRAPLMVFGDDDQCIYRFGGADPTLLNGRDAHQLVLSRSWRLPPAVHQQARSIITQVRRRVPKAFEPRCPEGGSIGVAAAWHEVDLEAEGRQLLIARNRVHLGPLREHLVEAGLPFRDRTSAAGVPDPHSVRGRAIRAVLDLVEGRVVRGSDLRALRRRVPARLWPQDQIGGAHAFWSIDHLTEAGATTVLVQTMREDPLGVLRGDESYVRRLVERHGRKVLDQAPRIELATIHGVKGEEAKHVAVCTNMTGQTWWNWLREPDDEHRVFYVGATRARERLTWVSLWDPSGRTYHPWM